MVEQETPTSTKPHGRGVFIAEAFLAGFASTVGMMAAFAAYNNRDRIRAAMRMLASP